jgi:TPR repeat protein
MRALRGVIVLVLALALPAPVLAADFQSGLEAYERGDYATALKEWRPLADQGYAGAQFNLGLIYENGYGVAQDYAEAAKWYRLAAEQGFAGAQFNLGLKYSNGQGVPQEYPEAVKWYRLAAFQGHAKAQRNLGIMYNEAVKWYRRAAEQGLARAQNNLGGMYRDGVGVPQDYVQAHKWYSLAITRSSPGEDLNPLVSARDNVEARMSPDQVAEAQRLAREWKPK